MRHRVLSVLAVTIVAALAVQLLFRPRPLLVWNGTHSAPTGLYRRSTDAVQRGSWVFVRPPDAAAKLAVARNYLPPGVPMVKRVAALSGDHVCRAGTLVTVNGRPTARALNADSLGRPLPRWSGCKRLGNGEIFLLTAPPASFDSRYFGPVSSTNLIERIEPLWTSSLH